MKHKPNTLPVQERDISKLIKDQLEIYTAQKLIRYFRAHPVRPVTRKGRTFFVPVDESQKGAPDYFVFLPAEIWLVETKKPGEGLRPHQTAWQRWAESRVFYLYYKIDTLKAANNLLALLKNKLRRNSMAPLCES